MSNSTIAKDAGSTLGQDPAGRALRTRFGVAAAVLVIAVTASCVIATIIATRLAVRLDVTATRAHQLSPQTMRILGTLDKPVELVLAAQLSSLDKPLRQRTGDVLEQFQRATPKLTVTIIDTGTTEGLAKYDALLSRLAEQHKPAIDRQVGVVRAAADASTEGAKTLDEVGESLMGVRAALEQAQVSPASLETLRKYFEGEAGKCRGFGEELRKAADETRTRLSKPADPLPTPEIDLISGALRVPLARATESLSILSSALDRFVRTDGVPAPARERAEASIAALAQLRDKLARRLSELDSLGTLPVLAVARSIQRTRAAILIGEPEARSDGAERPRALAAIDPDALLPQATTRSDGTQQTLDVRFRTEELIAAALATFTGAVRPAAVFVHGGSTRFGPSMGPWNRVAGRLKLRGVDCFEWAAAIDDQPPVIVSADPKNPRPVAYIVVGMEVRRVEDAPRMSRLASATKQLISEGKNVLLAASPSTLPATGATDPLVEPLGELGIKVETGLLLLEEARPSTPGSTARSVLSGMEFVDPGATHPISGAIAGVPTALPLAIMPIRIMGKEPPKGVTIQPLITLPVRPTLWAESEWQGFYQSLSQGRPAGSLPKKDSERDDAGGPGPWNVAVAIERHAAELKGRQRVVVVGSMPWTLDIFADQPSSTDGRMGQKAPGNVELLHAAIAWLTGREELIARSAESMATPVIPPISSAQRSAIQWALIGGMPLATLLCGAIWRLLRG